MQTSPLSKRPKGNVISNGIRKNDLTVINQQPLESRVTTCGPVKTTEHVRCIQSQIPGALEHGTVQNLD